MSKPENNLARALGENGAFDPDKAKEMQQKAVGTFEAKMRKAERCLWIYMCLCAWLAVFALFQFFHATTTKEMLFNALMFLIFIEGAILIRLWYFITNNKISMLKEIKQLQLGRLSADDADAPPWAKKLQGPLRGLSGRERAAWWIVLACGLVLVGVVKASDTYWSPGCGASLTSEGCVTLAADGGGLAVTEISFVYQGIETTDSIDFSAPAGAVLHFTDSHGHQLPFTTSPENGHVRYNVDLIHPVWPGHRFSYIRVQERPDYATQKGDVWTCSMHHSDSYGTNQFAETVVLPEGAQIVSVTPWPVATFTLQGKPTVRFQATRGRNEPFKYTIQYRLPAEPSEQKTAD